MAAVEVEAVTAAEVVVQVTWLSSHLHWRLEVMPSRLELVEQAARPRSPEVLEINQDSRLLESTSVLWEEAEVRQTG